MLNQQNRGKTFDKSHFQVIIPYIDLKRPKNLRAMALTFSFPLTLANENHDRRHFAFTAAAPPVAK